jgi:hypothetical protein
MQLRSRVHGLRTEVRRLRDEVRTHRQYGMDGCGGWDTDMQRGIDAYLERTEDEQDEEMVEFRDSEGIVLEGEELEGSGEERR